MNTYLSKALSIFALFCISNQSLAGLIGADLTGESTQWSSSYINLFEDKMSDNSDGFQRYQLGHTPNIPEQFIDRSNSGADSLGIIDESNPTSFFGIVDTINSNNSVEAISSWTFSITGFNHLSFGIDIAAMGDFERSDYFRWYYSIDNAMEENLFASMVDETIVQHYQLLNNNLTLEDPMLINGQLLNNRFQRFNSNINGVGDKLTITLAATFNGGSEVAAFKNLTVSGSAITAQVSSISEPPIFILFSLCCSLLCLRQKRTNLTKF